MPDLKLALDELAAVARRLGVDAHDARREGVVLAATVASAAQPMYRAAQDWARATGMADPDNLKAANEAFVESASSGRKWRASPTTLVSHLRSTGTGAAEYADALADVVEAAATLGGGNAAVTENVVQTAQAQRLAPRGPARDPRWVRPLAEPAPGPPGPGVAPADRRARQPAGTDHSFAALPGT
jgi:hypothetical protein